MGPMGGTEILLRKLHQYVDQRLLQRVNLLVSTADRNLLRTDKKNILWHHLDIDQENSQGFSDKEFVASLDAIVFVSNWQLQEHIKHYALPRSKCFVLLNAIDEIKYIPRQDAGKIKLIYTSTPWRGLEVLVEAFKLLDNRYVELDVYSSTVIYGTQYLPGKFDWLFDRCRQTKGINYRGYVANKAVIRACQGANIFAYPSIFRETSCLSAIEAGAAGLQIVCTTLGALPETCGGWAKMVEPDKNLVYRYGSILSQAVDNYWSNPKVCQDQSEWFNSVYSWQKRSVEWNQLLENYA